MTQKNKDLTLYLVYLAALLPMIILRDFTPANELRYLSIADEALSNNSFFAFTNQGEPYADKPPLYLWGVMLCKWLSGGHYMILLSLLSVIPAIVITRVFNSWTKNVIPERYRTASQLMLLTGGLFLVSSVTLRMDIMMCMFIVLSLYEFWKIYESKRDISTHQWLFPVYVFLAVFTKGPLGFLVPLVSTLCYLILVKKYRMIFKVWGWRCWLVLISGCCIWFGSVYADGGPEYLNNLLFHQTVDRAVKSFHHAAPFYYYLVCIWYCLVPWSLVMLALMVSGIKRTTMQSGVQQFFITVSITTLILLSCISSKIQIYMLPAIPFIIYSMAISLPKHGEDKVVKLGFAIIAGIFALALPGFFIARQIMKSPYIEPAWFWATASMLTICGIYTLYVLYRKNTENRMNKSIIGLSSAMLASIFTAGLAIPELNRFIGYSCLSEKIMEKSSKLGIDDIRCWRVKRAENMDVFLNREIENISDSEYYPKHLNDSVSQPYILVTRVKALDRLPGVKADTIGKFCIIVIDSEIDNNMTSSHK